MRRLGVLAVAVLVGLSACGGGDGGDADQARFCERLDRLTRNDPFLAFGDTASPDDIEVAFDALRDRASELLEVAPPEVRAAARDYDDAVEALDALLAAAGYVGADVDTRAYRNEKMAYAEAAQRLERYLDAEC